MSEAPNPAGCQPLPPPARRARYVLDFTACAEQAERAGLGQPLVEDLGRYPTAAEVMARINAASAERPPEGGPPPAPGSGRP